MIYEIKTVDGVKTKVPLTGNGYGLPLGTIIAVYSNTVPDGFLPCNGTTYDTTTYSALYAYLGSNKLPDLRECVLVGAGQSSNEYDASTNPNGIHEHDVYDVGEFKDDQFQGHWHGGGTWVNTVGWVDGSGHLKTTANGGTDPSSNGYSSDGHGEPRYGTTTHGKQVGVNYCIKATPAYVEPDTVSDMVNTLRTQDSYSTEEVNTGKKWIDGKPIYRKVFTGLNIATTSARWFATNIDSSDIDCIVHSQMIGIDSNALYQENEFECIGMVAVNKNTKKLDIDTFGSVTVKKIAIEYTKTTD